MLPHFTQLSNINDPAGPGTLPQEPVWKNLFEVSFILPTLLVAQGRDPFILLPEATSVSLDLTKDIKIVEQRYKYSTRAYLGMPDKTHVEFAIDFNVNVSTGGSMESWNILKAWYDLVWNSQDGTVGYKSDVIGTIIVNQHDKKGVVLRRVTFQNVQLQGVDKIDLKFDGGGELWSVNTKFVADYWIDEYIDSANIVIGNVYG